MLHLLLIPVGKALAAHWAVGHAATAAGLGAHPLTTPLAASHGPLLEQAATAVIGKAGVLTGQALATHAAATAAAPTLGHVLPLHLLPLHAVVGAAIGTAGAAGVGAVALSPAVTHAMTTLASNAAKGYAITRLKAQHGGRLDLRELKRWFGITAEQDDVLFTATGEVRGGRFFTEPCPARGPAAMLQGTIDPQTQKVRQVRLIHGIDSVSGSIKAGHRHTGLALYAPPKSS